MTEKTPSSDNPDQPHSQFTLLTKRRFWPLFLTQFTGAFNDNAYKNALIVLVGFGTLSVSSMEPKVLANLAAGIFVLPFLLFSATAGQLADKFDKAKLARCVKALEIPIILLAGAGFGLQNLYLLLAALFLLGLQSTLFGPVKYAILPQHLRASELVGGNALVEAGTFVAILIGTLTGGLLAGFNDAGIACLIGVCMAMAIGGFLASCRIPAAPAPVPGLKISLNLFAETWRSIRYASQERSVFQSILALSWFWGYGALLLVQFPLFSKDVIGGDNNLVTALLAIFSIGIGLGSLICEKLTRRRGKAVEPGLVPIGALGMTIFGLDLSLGAFAQTPPTPDAPALLLSELLQHGSTWRFFFDLMMLGGFGGLYCVPLYALVQHRSEEAVRARIIAANNIINALFMIATAVLAGVLLDNGFSIPMLFLVMAVLHGIITVYIFSVVPEFIIRALIWLGLRRE